MPAEVGNMRTLHAEGFQAGAGASNMDDIRKWLAENKLRAVGEYTNPLLELSRSFPTPCPAGLSCPKLSFGHYFLQECSGLDQ